ncbi:MAG: acyloxyacyl hydrolase [Bacteroidetes bacterium]|nr:acyloxyacyl hydrolase [Bacteroidota bacterium]
MNYLIGLLLILFSIKLPAQNKDSVIYSFGAKWQYASIWTNRTILQPFTQSHPQSFQFDLGVLKNTNQAWNNCGCYSQNGLSVSYTDFNNSKLGHAFTIAAFTQPLLYNSNRFQLSIRGSAGLAFVNKLYDSISNKDNIFFSASSSFYLGLGLNFSFRISNHLQAISSLQFNHISNGGKRDPNEGMNFPAVNVVVNYVVNPTMLNKRPNQKFTDKSWSLALHTFGTQRSVPATWVWPAATRWVLGVNVGLIKRLGRMNGVGVGGEFYNDGIKEVLQQRSNQRIQTQTGAVSIQHYLFFGKLLFGQQAAWFVTPKTGYQKKFYQRYFLEYAIKKNWYLGVSLKAHGDHSDFLALSTGYLFKID